MRWTGLRVTSAAFGAVVVLAHPQAGSAEGSDGTWGRAVGRDVDFVQPGLGSEICTVAANCKGGLPGVLGGQFNHPTSFTSTRLPCVAAARC